MEEDVLIDLGAVITDLGGATDIGVEGGNMAIYDWLNADNWRFLYGQGKRFVEDVQNNWDYWQTQIPYYGDYLNAQETKQFWADYKKNTGFSPRYPRRAYGSQGTTAIHSASRLFRNFKRLYG